MCEVSRDMAQLELQVEIQKKDRIAKQLKDDCDKELKNMQSINMMLARVSTTGEKQSSNNKPKEQ